MRSKLFAVGLLTACGVAASAGAVGIEYTWVNSAGTAWDSDAKWSITNLNGNATPSVGQRYPGAGSRTTDIVIIPDFANDPVYAPAGPLTVESVLLDNGARMDISSGKQLAVNVDFTVDPSATLDIEGDLSIGRDLLQGTSANVQVDGSLDVARDYPTASSAVVQLNGPLSVGRHFTHAPNATVDIDAACTFDLGGNYLLQEDNGFTIDGVLNLTASSSNLIVDGASLVAQINGAGSIVGALAASKITVPDAGDELISFVSIQGRMQVTGSGEFDSRDEVLATTGAIQFGANLVLDDVGGAFWRANGASAKLEFLKAHTSANRLAGGFEMLNSARIDLKQNMDTDGAFNNPGGACGSVIGTSGMVFTWDYSGSPQTCAP